jgi:hypothetical protein
VARAVQQWLTRLEGQFHSGGGACPECGLGEAPVDYVVDFDDEPGFAEAEEEWCPECGRQFTYVIQWHDIEGVA